MLLHDANDTWEGYRSYIVNLFWNGWISAEDYHLSEKHGKLYKDGKPYTRKKDLSFDSLNELNYKPRSFENKLLDAQYESAVKHYLEMREYTFNNLLKSKTMESVKVTPPEGYEIDKEKSTTSEIFFRKKDDRVRRWEDLKWLKGWWINEDSIISTADCRANDSKDKNVWPTKELAEAALALSELMQYRQRWIGDWKPDWCNSDPKYCLIFKRDLLDYECLLKTSHPLSFPTKEMIHDFTTTFRNLLETAKPLL